jgi:7-keto-8-aminopelargonate synthetase-like enzyme
LEEAEKEGLKRSLRGVSPVSARECRVEGVDSLCLDFSSNNYLGIADHPKLIEESINWIRRFGASSKASRLVSGTNPAYLELEERIAEWKGSEAALLFGSGYMANLGLISALTGRKGAIFADRLNHASINAGVALSGAKHIRYRHNDLRDLREKFAVFMENTLAKTDGVNYRSQRDMLIVTDSVFSMDGDIAPITEIAEFAESVGAFLYIDDAHATGFFGDNGEGMAGADAADVWMAT